MSDRTTARPSQLFRNLSAKIASIPMILTALVVFVGGTLWTVLYSFTNSQAAAAAELRRPRPVRAPVVDAALADLDREPRDLRRPVADLLAGHRLPAGRAARPEDPLRGHVPHHLPLSLRAVLHRHRPGLAVDPQPGLRRADSRARASAGRASPSTRSTTSDIVIYGILIAGALAGHRPRHVPDARRPARHRRGHLEGRAGRRHPDVEDLSLHRHPDDAPGVHHHAGHHRLAASSSVYDLVVAQTSGGPGIASEVPAKYVYDYMFRAQNLGQGFAASTMMLLSVAIIVVPWAYLEFGGQQAWLTRQPRNTVAVGTDAGRRPAVRPARRHGRAATLSRPQHHALRHADRRRRSTTCCRST